MAKYRTREQLRAVFSELPPDPWDTGYPIGYLGFAVELDARQARHKAHRTKRNPTPRLALPVYTVHNTKPPTDDFNERLKALRRR